MKPYNHFLLLTFLFSLTIFASGCTDTKPAADDATTADVGIEEAPPLIPVIFDTDANNELDDQHALAYLVFNGQTFDVRGVTANATDSGGAIDNHVEEAERVLKLCNVDGQIPLYSGANADFEDIRPNLNEPEFDGFEAVNFIIKEARKAKDQKLVLLPVGKLTNIALALESAPDIKENVRIVWLGSNYPEPGEYNQRNDIPSLNYILEQDVPFEMVMVRYGKASGSDAVRVTPAEIEEKMTGIGPVSEAVEGRHGGSFTNFGDYSVDLFKHIDLHGDPPARALFDMVAVAVVKKPEWGKTQTIPAPILEGENWKERPENHRTIIIWENFDKDAILKDFYSVMESPVIAKRH